MKAIITTNRRIGMRIIKQLLATKMAATLMMLEASATLLPKQQRNRVNSPAITKHRTANDILTV